MREWLKDLGAVLFVGTLAYCYLFLVGISQ